jgi:hypothetical protein
MKKTKGDMFVPLRNITVVIKKLKKGRQAYLSGTNYD